MEKTTKLARAVPPATALCVLCAYAAVANDSAVPIAGKRNRKPGSGSISAEGKRPGRQLPETAVPNRAPSNPRPAEQAAGYDERNRKPGSVFEKKTAKRPTGATVPTSTRQNGRPRVGYEARRRTVRRANGPISRSGSFVAEKERMPVSENEN